MYLYINVHTIATSPMQRWTWRRRNSVKMMEIRMSCPQNSFGGSLGGGHLLPYEYSTSTCNSTVWIHGYLSRVLAQGSTKALIALDR